MTNSPWRYKVVNTFGTLGYISGIVQCAWTGVVLCYPLVTMDRSIFFPRPSHPAATPTPDFGPLSPILLIVAIAFTLLVLALTVITIIRLPRTIGTSGAKTTHTVAKAVIPTVVHHKEISKKQYITLSYRIVIGLKYLMAILPLALLAFAPPIAILPSKVIIVVGIITASFTLFYFSIQLVLASVLRTDKKKVW